jgi:hypothetical protein
VLWAFADRQVRARFVQGRMRTATRHQASVAACGPARLAPPCLSSSDDGDDGDGDDRNGLLCLPIILFVFWDKDSVTGRPWLLSDIRTSSAR